MHIILCQMPALRILVEEHGADVNLGTTYSPLIFALHMMSLAKKKGQNYVEEANIVKFLLEKGAQKNTTSPCTPLEFAKREELAEVLSLLRG